jgi:hypothetical protein
MTAPPENQSLPQQFAELERWRDWIQWSDEERTQKQVNSTVEELGEFYRGMLPHAGAIYEYLYEKPLEGMSDEDLTLLCLGVALAEIADGVEFYSPESTAADAMPRFLTLHDSLFGYRPQEVA